MCSLSCLRDDNFKLLAPVSLEEVKAAVFNPDPESTPGQDEYTGFFLQTLLGDNWPGFISSCAGFFCWHSFA